MTLLRSIGTLVPQKHAALLVFAACASLMVALDALDNQAYMIDSDDRLRELQIRSLIAGSGWFDTTLAFIRMPEVYVSPWSRIVDLPYYFIALVLGPLLGPDLALSVAFAVWPLVLLAVFAFLAVQAMRLLKGSGVSALQAAVSAALMVFAFWQFVPGRIDHHNIQLVLMLAMLAGLAVSDRLRGGFLAGVAATLSITVGLECLPFIAAAFGGLALAAAIRPHQDASRLAACGVGFALSAPVAGLAFGGPAVMLQSACDAMSGVWLAAILLFGGVAAAAPGLWRMRVFSGPSGPVLRIASLAMLAAGCAGVLVAMFPSCLQGPYAMIDPLTRAFWLERLDQEGSAAVLLENGAYGVLAMLAIYAVCLGFAAAPVWRRLSSGRSAAAIVWFVAAASVASAMLQLRFITFPSAFVPLLLPMTLAELPMPAIRRRLLPATLVPLLLAGLAGSVHSAPKRYDVVDLMAGDRCVGEDLSVLDRVPDGVVVAPLGLAFEIVEHRSGHAVAALPFHRASSGIRRVALAFTGDDTDTRRQALAGFDYVAVCRRDIGYDLTPAPLYRALMQDIDIAGLDPVNPDDVSRFRLYRIDASGPEAFALPWD